MTATRALSPPRPILHRTAGRRHGPITRLVSPADLGELIKPFVFLDLIAVPPGSRLGPGFGWHPHSGIATVTIAFNGNGWYADSTGETGDLQAGCVEWMQAGGGVWHTGGPSPADLDGKGILGFQLWLALPEALELAPPKSLYLAPESLPAVGPARIILGQYGAAKSPIPRVADLTYVQVTLAAGEIWVYRPPAGQTVAWLAVAAGRIEVSGVAIGPEVAIFSPSEAEIRVAALEPTQFVLGSAAPHPHRLVLGHYSVHTCETALLRGEAGIRSVKSRLEADGRLAQSL
jgi:redox-sensitive bicupin YhaK (pirin superfamily)